MTVWAYVRVSTADQNSELLVRELCQYAERQGADCGDLPGCEQRRKGQPPCPESPHVSGPAREFNCLLVWKLDRFGRSHVDCLNNIKTLEENGARLIAVTQGLDTDLQNPAWQFLLHVLGAAAEFKRSSMRERTQAGQARYRQDFESGKVGKTVASRWGRNLPPYRPRKIFDREEVLRLRRQGRSYRQIARSLGFGLGTVVRTLQARAKSS